jgi:hypothetical protein
LYIFFEIESASPASSIVMYWRKTASIAAASSLEDAPGLLVAKLPNGSEVGPDFM